MQFDPSQPVTQQAFGEMVDLSQSTVSDLIKRGVIRFGAPVGEWLKGYCHHLREVAAGRVSDNSPELTAERARLAREQADKLAMQNRASRAELAPAAFLEHVLSQAGARASRILAGIPCDIAAALPQLSTDDVRAIDRIVSKAARVAEEMSLRDVGDATEDDEAILVEMEGGQE